VYDNSVYDNSVYNNSVYDKVTPAMAAGVSRRLLEMKDVVDRMEAWEASR
jgi:hypothetical protein